MLSHFENWNGLRSAEYVPLNYTAALVNAGDASQPWPWPDVGPADFAETDFLPVARLTPQHVAIVAGENPTGGTAVNVKSYRILIRPLLPGDDHPGAFGIRPDTVAVTVTSDVRVRSLPEVSDESLKVSPLLSNGEPLYVLEGPVEGSGYRWYKVYAPRPELVGWVAAASKEDGERWISPFELLCTLGASPQEHIDELGYDLMRLACFKGNPFTLQGMLQHRAADCDRAPDVRVEPSWLNVDARCVYRVHTPEPSTGGVDFVEASRLHANTMTTVQSLIAHAGDPDEGVPVEVVGELDHPDSRTCTTTDEPSPPPDLVRLRCRATFVVFEVRPAG